MAGHSAGVEAIIQLRYNGFIPWSGYVVSPVGRSGGTTPFDQLVYGKRASHRAFCFKAMNKHDFFADLHEYSHKDGVLYRIKNSNGKYINPRPAKSKDRHGYIALSGLLCGRQVHAAAHQVVWVMFYHHIPQGYEIDHINGVRDDNRIENLRLVTRMQNQWNRAKRKDSLSQFKGVSYDKKGNKWIAEITVNGKRTHLGSFESEHDAGLAYHVASRLLQGEYARY